MKLEKYLLQQFNDPKLKDEYTVDVPWGSHFKGALVLHDGIYLWYEIPELELVPPKTRPDTFKILRPHESIPDGAKFVVLLDTIVETEERVEGQQPQQGVMVFPIYQLNK